MSKYVINIDYPKDKQAQLKAIASFRGETARDFIANAVDHYSAFLLDNMSKGDKHAVNNMVKNYSNK